MNLNLADLIEQLENTILKTQEDLVMTNYPDVSLINLQEAALSAISDWHIMKSTPRTCENCMWCLVHDDGRHSCHNANSPVEWIREKLMKTYGCTEWEQK